jgi:hypothetical protein
MGLMEQEERGLTREERKRDEWGLDGRVKLSSRLDRSVF